MGMKKEESNVYVCRRRRRHHYRLDSPTARSTPNISPHLCS